MGSSSTNNDPPISTRRPSDIEKILKDKYAESIAAQSDQMDNLGRQLIAIELGHTRSVRHGVETHRRLQCGFVRRAGPLHHFYLLVFCVAIDLV